VKALRRSSCHWRLSGVDAFDVNRAGSAKGRATEPGKDRKDIAPAHRKH
jgi:hypothetical protein